MKSGCRGACRWGLLRISTVCGFFKRSDDYVWDEPLCSWGRANNMAKYGEGTGDGILRWIFYE